MGLFEVPLRCHALLERRRLHRTGANRVAANPLANEINGYGLGKSDDSSFRAGINKPVGGSFDAGSTRRHIDDTSSPCPKHAGQYGTTGAIHRLHIEVERRVPIFLFTIQDRAVMNIASTVEQDIERPSLGHDSLNGFVVADVQVAGAYRRPFSSQFIQRGLIDIGCPDDSTFVREAERSGSCQAFCRTRQPWKFFRKAFRPLAPELGPESNRPLISALRSENG